MSSPTGKKVLKLYMLAHEIALPVIRAFIVNNTLDGVKYKDFNDFLQQHMHQIYHLFVNMRCCKCEPIPMKSKSGCKITMPQLKKLYIVGQSNVKHLIRTNVSISQQCMCGLSVNNSCTLKQLDISLIHAIFKECVILQQDHMMWLDKINEQRNKLCHIGDLSELTESHTNTMWGYLDGSIVGLASAVPPYPDYMESIERQISLLKIADYSLDAVKPVINEMKMEWRSMQSEINDNMNTRFGALAKHRASDVKETHDQILAAKTEISTQLVAMNKELQIIKGNMMSHKRANMIFDIELAPKLNLKENNDASMLSHMTTRSVPTIAPVEISPQFNSLENHDASMLSHMTTRSASTIAPVEISPQFNSLENHDGDCQNTLVVQNTLHKGKYIVEYKISTPGAIGEKKEEIKQFFQKAIDICNLVAPFEVKFVSDGSITITTLMPVGILQNEDELKKAICKFLDQMVTNCDIDTSSPLVVKVKITVFDTEKGICITEDINPAAMQSDSDDSFESIYRRSPGLEHQNINCPTPLGWKSQPETPSIPLTKTSEAGLSVKGYDVVEASNDADIGIPYLHLARTSSTLTHNYTDHELSQGSLPFSGVSERGNPVVQAESNDDDIKTPFSEIARSSFTATSSYSELEKTRGSTGFSVSFSKDCAECKMLMHQLNCEATKQFWREIDNDGPNSDHSCHVKLFEKFLERLIELFPKEEGLKSESTISLLKVLLYIDPKDPNAGIKLSDLKRITDLFGPIKKQDTRCVLIYQLHILIKRSMKTTDEDKRIKSSWFVGDMTRNEAEKCLLAQDCKDNTYLVRISGAEGDDGEFTLSVRHGDHCHRLKIKGNPKTALSESPYNAHLKFAGREFSSLPDVMDFVTYTQEIELDREDGTTDCSSVMCLRIFTKSPLNGVMAGYFK